MKDGKSFIMLISFLLVSVVFSGCRIAQDRPILRIPDGNKDRMLKEIFFGTNAKPKYWISKVTVVNSDFGTEGLGIGDEFVFEGLQSQAKVGYFEFTRDKLKFNNAVTRQALEEPEVASQGIEELINKWDIKHSEFRLKEVDGYTTNIEEENDYIPWHEKKYFTIDWSKADISEASTFPYIDYVQRTACWKKKTAHLIDSSREIIEDYISFVIAVEYEQGPVCSESLRRWKQNNFTTTVHYKYSFKTVPDPRLPDKNYIPYVYDGENDPLLRKYGYYRTVRPVIADEDDRNKNVFYMNRWHPNKKHIFYFSKNYPEKYKDIAYGVICSTNKLFARHRLSNYPLNGKCKEDGSVLPGKKETCTQGICFELRENQGQEFGDIRYSFFHMLDKYVPVLGYGPTDSHPATGEILSGNIVISTYLLDFYLKKILQLFYTRDGEEYYNEKAELVKGSSKYEDSSLFVKMKQTLKENDHNLWTETSRLIDKDSEIRPDFEYLLSQLTFGDPNLSQFTSSNTMDHSVDLNGILFSNIMLKDIIEESQKIINQSRKSLIKKLSHERNTTIYPLEPVIAQIPFILANGMSLEEAKKRILFMSMSHEFGHVLNLRHNFYGSFDSSHWPKEDSGQFTLKSSSIMDYLNVKDGAEGPLKASFGPYDEAALVYAYSGGKKDLSMERNTQYLFCTDHHEPLNFLCNHWDRGETASQVMMSLIENYEETYFVRNLRLDRAYWDTRFYPYEMFNDMWDMKRALLMWVTAFNEQNISDKLDQSIRSYTKEQKSFISKEIRRDMRQAIKLSLAFYNSVLQLSSADRDWKDSYNEESGDIERIGILWDKTFAILFMMGDDKFVYNPNYFLGYASYLTYINQLGFRQMIEEIMENALTVRVDMKPWFIDFGRFLYAQNASNYYNIVGNGDLLEKIGVHCYTPKGLKDRFGIEPNSYKISEDSLPDRLDTAVVSMEDYLDTITDSYYFGTNEKLGITFFDGDYYVASSNLNKYSFTIIDNMRRITYSLGRSLRLDKQDVYDMFHLYHMSKKKGVIPKSCDDGY